MSKVGLNCGVTGPKLTKFSHDVARSWLLLMRLSGSRQSNLFWNAKATNERESILPILTLKLVGMVTSLERSGKEGQINNLLPNITYGKKLVKIGKVDPEISG